MSTKAAADFNSVVSLFSHAKSRRESSIANNGSAVFHGGQIPAFRENRAAVEDDATVAFTFAASRGNSFESLTEILEDVASGKESNQEPHNEL